jgi:hypothetical protein
MKKWIKDAIIGGLLGAIWGVIALVFGFVISPLLMDTIPPLVRIILFVTVSLPALIPYSLGYLFSSYLCNGSSHCGDIIAFKIVLPLTIPTGIVLGVILYNVIKRKKY